MNRQVSFDSNLLRTIKFPLIFQINDVDRSHQEAEYFRAEVCLLGYPIRPSTVVSAMDIILLLLLFLPLAGAQMQVCGNSGNYTGASNYQANLNQLSATLPKNAASNTTLFATGIAGTAPDKVYALALCRGDINSSACAACLSTSFQDAQQLCPFNKDAAVYYDYCSLRFSNLNILATTMDDNILILMNTQNFTVTRLILFTLLSNTSQFAAQSLSRFMTSRMDISSLPTLYSLVQSGPSLSFRGPGAK
ncbi:hypothetical protein EJB05_30487, partial [Eragrostis curvula]